MVFLGRWSDYTGSFKPKIKSKGLNFGGLIGQLVIFARWSLAQVLLYYFCLSILKSLPVRAQMVGARLGNFKTKYDLEFCMFLESSIIAY